MKIKMTEAGIFKVTSSRQCKFVIENPEMAEMLHPCTIGGRSDRPTVTVRHDKFTIIF